MQTALADGATHDHSRTDRAAACHVGGQSVLTALPGSGRQHSSVEKKEAKWQQACHSPVNIEVDPVMELALVGAWVCVDGDADSGQGCVAISHLCIGHIVHLNEDRIIHKHMIGDASTCSNRQNTCWLCQACLCRLGLHNLEQL